MFGIWETAYTVGSSFLVMVSGLCAFRGFWFRITLLSPDLLDLWDFSHRLCFKWLKETQWIRSAFSWDHPTHRILPPPQAIFWLLFLKAPIAPSYLFITCHISPSQNFLGSQYPPEIKWGVGLNYNPWSLSDYWFCPSLECCPISPILLSLWLSMCQVCSSMLRQILTLPWEIT